MRLHKDDMNYIVGQLFDRLMEEKASKIAAKKARTPRTAKAEAYTEAFEQCWSAYPSRPDNNKQDGFSAFQQRVKDGESEFVLMSKTNEYAAHCDSEEKTGTKYVLRASTFYGPSKRYNDGWKVAVKKKTDEPWAKIPYENNDIEPWARLHGFKMAGAGRSYADWRRALKIEIDAKLHA